MASVSGPGFLGFSECLSWSGSNLFHALSPPPVASPVSLPPRRVSGSSLGREAGVGAATGVCFPDPPAGITAPSLLGSASPTISHSVTPFSLWNSGLALSCLTLTVSEQTMSIHYTPPAPLLPKLLSHPSAYLISLKMPPSSLLPVSVPVSPIP